MQLKIRCNKKVYNTLIIYYIIIMERQKYKTLRRFIKQFLPVDDITGKIKPYKVDYVVENIQKFCNDAIKILKSERF